MPPVYPKLRFSFSGMGAALHVLQISFSGGYKEEEEEEIISSRGMVYLGLWTGRRLYILGSPL